MPRSVSCLVCGQNWLLVLAAARFFLMYLVLVRGVCMCGTLLRPAQSWSQCSLVALMLVVSLASLTIPVPHHDATVGCGFCVLSLLVLYVS